MKKNSLARPHLTAAEIEAINKRFQAEAEKYNLAYRCQQCVHVLHGEDRCTLGYPNEKLVQGDVKAVDENGGFVFCKDFELED